ncbi:hypothetical protein GGTG_04581 [Gaeumannomyces tritici R3-111a-1]|uniref:Uncharacterized protein n=1 Tax=Gaeumannomyces tritici (strain R3-111a-1) TaxID=644352 RepID=J3NTI1_GAET3|nr:hypothetical protein GGTG_04581 [Gaeumannomyces tritici R3-111a-1]EJT79497.1 hypothetical protein GGTG_04581 [Gaeumannomyces tritici R3-111a-1]
MSDSNDIYTLGWISAIPSEFVAARFFLDTQPCRPKILDPHDTNSYSLGKIGHHNVVMACLPDGEYGITAAAVVATNMLRSFPNIRFSLMVGIGGGAPSSRNNMRLGDIVVSSPVDGEGGVFQYDFGKSIQNRAFTHTRHLNQPPTALRTAVSVLRTQHKTDGHRYEAQIAELLKGKRRSILAEFSRPPPTSDRLYMPTFVHLDDDKSCQALCGDRPEYLVPRPEREEPEDGEDFAVVHYGLIASANQLMKDATIRDQLASMKRVLCFEMEAAGLMNNFPCLVIRGICDYSDSHKNKEWQGFAAMMAAAYAKDLLCQIVPSQVEEEKQADKYVQTANSAPDSLRSNARIATTTTPPTQAATITGTPSVACTQGLESALYNIAPATPEYNNLWSAKGALPIRPLPGDRVTHNYYNQPGPGPNLQGSQARPSSHKQTAKSVFEEHLNIYETTKMTYGFDHPDTLRAAHKVASMLKNQEKLAAALEWYDRIYKSWKKTLVPDHPQTLQAARDVADVLKEMGKDAAALDWYDRIYQGRKATLGPDDPETLQAAHGVSRMLVKQGKRKLAIEWYEAILKAGEKLVPGHPAIVEAEAALAGIRVKSRFTRGL